MPIPPSPSDASKTTSPPEDETLQVLLVEDNPGDARLFEEYLGESSTEAALRHEETLQAGLGALEEERPDVLVVDLGLPDSDGADTVKAVVAAAPEVPIVVLTGRDDLDVAMQAQEAGAAEYLQKDELGGSALVSRTLRWAVRQHRMQAKLRERDAWIRSITEGLSAGVFRAGPTGHIEYANEAMAQMLGFGQAERLVGQDLTTFYADPTDRGRMLAEGGATEVEVEFEGQDGSTFTALLSATVAYDGEGRPLHYDGTVTDITDRVRRKERLRMLSEAVEQAKEAVLITEAAPLDEPGPRVEYVNSACEAMTGYSEEEMVGKTPRVHQGPDTERDVLDSLRAALEAGDEWEGETVNYRKDGTPYRVQWNVSPVREEDGSVEHWVSVQRDVTEQREREKQLAQLAQALEQVDDKVFITDREGEIQYVNEAFEEITGYAEEEVVGKTPAVLQSGAQDEAFYEELWETILSGKTFRTEFVNEKKDGTRFVEDEHISPITNEEGEITHFVSAGRDVTERKDREEALRRHRNLLQQTQRLAGAWEVNLRTGHSTGSEEVYRILEAEDKAGFTVGDGFQFFTPEARSKLQEAFEQCAEEGEPYDLELPIITGEGNRRWVRTVGAPAETKNGEVTKVAGALQDITARKEAEESLQRSRERYRSLFRDSTDAILIHDLEGRIQEANPQAESLFGREAGGLEGQSIRDLHVPEEQETAQEKLQALEAGESYQAMSRYERAGGPTFWGEVSANATDIGGETVVRTLIRDVTARVESRRQLERQKAYTDRLLNATEDLFFALDEEAQFQRWNDRVPEVTGYSGEELEERSALDLVPESDRERVVAAIAEGFKTGSAQIEVPILRKDGTTVPYEFMGNLVEHSEGGLRVVGIGRDITERRRRQRTLERQNDLFERAQRIANVGAWEYDVQADESTWTEKAYHIAGLPTSADTSPENTVEIYHSEDRPRVREAFNRAVEEGEPFDLEARIVAEDGTKWVRVRGEPQREAGAVARVRGTIRDITERKERERQLIDAKEEAERMSRLKSAFLANMSHEIRTPLTSILGFAEAIGGEVESLQKASEVDLSTLAEFSSLIERSGRRLMDTLTGVLNLSKLQAGEMDLDLGPVDLASEAEEAVEEFGPQATNGNLDLTVESEDGPIRTRADDGGLGIVLRNLLSNAIKYTDEGGQVWVRVRRAGDMAAVEVEDTGIGMDPETTQGLFEAFKQASEGVGREYEGTGLGLTVTREVLDQMGGSIEVETEKGEGSRFTVRLPRTEAPSGT